MSLVNPRITVDANYYKFYGNSVLECWYPMGTFHNIFSSATTAANTLYASPFVSGNGGWIDEVRINVSSASAAGGKAVFGIYKNVTTAGTIYPGDLLVTSGEVSIDSTGIKSLSTTTYLEPNANYFFAILCNASATFRGSNATGHIAIVGKASLSGAASARTRLSGSNAYGSLPVTFPSGFSGGTTVTIGIMHFSS
jgi:hypothetical protein